MLLITWLRVSHVFFKENTSTSCLVVGSAHASDTAYRHDEKGCGGLKSIDHVLVLSVGSDLQCINNDQLMNRVGFGHLF